MLIGITGGVGCGKSTVLDYLVNKYDFEIYKADDMAKELLKPETSTNAKIRKLLPKECFNEDGSIHTANMARELFNNPDSREKMNSVVFPAVKEEVIKIKAGTDKKKIVFFEAALLIEDHYDEVCDELWYIYADEKTRAIRLKESRHYTDEKIDSMMKSQLSEEIFRKTCNEIIDNSKDFEVTKEQIDLIIKRIGADK